jgi:hypothetical protein
MAVKLFVPAGIPSRWKRPALSLAVGAVASLRRNRDERKRPTRGISNGAGECGPRGFGVVHRHLRCCHSGVGDHDDEQQDTDKHRR